MKNLKFLILYVFVFAGLISCLEDELIDNDIIYDSSIQQKDNLETSKIALIQLPMLTGKVSGVGTMLSFKDWNEYYETIDSLDLEMKNLSSSFMNQYNLSNYNENELDSIAQVLNFDYYKPIKNFEKTYKFNSLWSKINEEMGIWLSQQGDNFDFSTDPDNHFVVYDTERVLLKSQRRSNGKRRYF